MSQADKERNVTLRILAVSVTSSLSLTVFAGEDTGLLLSCREKLQLSSQLLWSATCLPVAFTAI